MTTNRTKRSAVNIVFAILNKIVVLLLPFAVRTVMIYTLGIQYLGLDSLFVSILSMLSLSEMGFSAAIIFSMYKPIANGDDEKVKALLCFYRNIYRIVGAIILVIGLIVLPNIKLFIADGTAYPTDVNLYLVYLVFLVNTCVSYFLFAYKSSILVATMRNDIDSLIDLARSIVSHGLQIIVLLLFKQYYLYILILPLVTISNDIIRNVIINKRFPQFIGKAKLPKEDKKDILTRVGALIGNKIGGVVFTSVDSIVISRFLGLTILAQFTNYFTIFSAIIGAQSAIFISIQSIVGNSLVKNPKEYNMRLFKNIFLLNAAFTCFCTCCFAILYQPFIHFWVGADNVLPASIPLLLSLYFFVRSIRRPLSLFKEAAGMWKEDFLKPYFSVVVNVGLNILLVNLIGLEGVVLSSIVALAVIELPWETIVFFKKYGNSNHFMYYVKIILFFVLSIYLTFLIQRIGDRIDVDGVLSFIIKILVIAIINLIFFLPLFTLTKEGKDSISFIKPLFKKRKKTNCN